MVGWWVSCQHVSSYVWLDGGSVVDMYHHVWLDDGLFVIYGLMVSQLSLVSMYHYAYGWLSAYIIMYGWMVGQLSAYIIMYGWMVGWLSALYTYDMYT